MGRDIHRIFGENLSFARQYVYTNAIWNRLGYGDRTPDRGYAQWLATLPRSTTTRFARGDHDRALVTIRDRNRLIGLPIINGAEGQHMHNPYSPCRSRRECSPARPTPPIRISSRILRWPTAAF